MRPLLLVLCITGVFSCSSTGGRAPVSDVTRSTYDTSEAKRGVITGKTYTVQKGDTLYSIAWRSGIAVNDISSRNNIDKSNIINLGQQLQLRSDSPKPIPPKPITKKIQKSDLSAQKTKKKSSLACSPQNCKQNTQKKVASEKTKAYSKVKPDKEMSNKNNKKVLVSKGDNKVSDWAWPVQGKLTKKFSASPSGMQGISLVNTQGSLIHAAASGQVVYAGSGLRGYGNLIIIKHNYDYLSAYAHNETLLVRENEFIKKGQKIATMGDSGTDHVNLHFEIRYRGKSVDPLRYLPKR